MSAKWVQDLKSVMAPCFIGLLTVSVVALSRISYYITIKKTLYIQGEIVTMKELDLLRGKLLNSGVLDESCVSAICEIDRQLSLYHKMEKTIFNSELHLVYMHTTPDGRKYIGITRNLPNTRWNEGAGYESQKKFYRAIQKDGWDNIEHTIIAAGLTEKEAKALESELILEYKTYDPQYGYNTNLSVAEVGRVKSNAKTYAKQEKIREKSDVDICKELIEKYTIKTVDGVIYYITDTGYVKESNQPFIEKELLLGFNISSAKRRKEIINSIMVLSFTNKEDVFPDTADTPYSQDNQEVIRLLSVFRESGYTQVTEEDIHAFFTWLDETPERYICLPMIMEQVFHLKQKCPKLIGQRMGKAIRNNGWKPLPSSIRIAKYGIQRCFQRETYSGELHSKSNANNS